MIGKFLKDIEIASWLQVILLAIILIILTTKQEALK